MKHFPAKLLMILALCLSLMLPAMAEGDGAVQIVLSDAGVTVNGEAASGDESAAVYVANDIVYYESGKDFTYGEGEAEDEHDASEADAHTVVHISQPGTYEVSGTLSMGQIAVDLGEDADEDEDAVVTLILNGADITCTVAPAIIFYNVYEPCDDDEDSATKYVDTSAAGANIVIADGSENNLHGSYVARIYKSVELNEDGTKVVDSKKLHKYDGTLYSKMSMNVSGGGVLNIVAENEGLCSDLHLTIDGGTINIFSGNDGINTSEDNVSVCTINGGEVNVQVTGETGEGDGIDSNGWLVINGGSVTAAAYGRSADAGIDSDKGIHINGGSVCASGNMLDAVDESAQNYAVFSFASRQKGGSEYALKNADGETVFLWTPANDFTYLVVSDANLTPGTYTLWSGDVQLAGSKGGMMGGFGGMTPPDGEVPEMPEGMEMPENGFGGMPEMPEGMEMPENGFGGMPEMPEGMEMPENGFGGMPEMPEGMEMPQNGFGGGRGGFGGGREQAAELSVEFVIEQGGNMFSNISEN